NLSVRRAPADARSRADVCAGRGATVSRGAIPASGRGRVRRRPGCGIASVRRPRDQLSVKLYGADNKELMTVTAIERQGSDLVIKGKIFGTMPMTAKLRPAEARNALKLLGFRKALFVLSLLFRRS